MQNHNQQPDFIGYVVTQKQKRRKLLHPHWRGLEK